MALAGSVAVAFAYAGLSDRAASAPESTLAVAAPVLPPAERVPSPAERAEARSAVEVVPPGTKELRPVAADDLRKLTGLCPDRSDCPCLERAALGAFERGRAQAALALLREASSECRAGALMGVEAEALARVGRVSESERQAAAVLARDANDRYAVQARGLVAYGAGQFAEARRAARNALELGRGAAAHLLLGLVEYQTKNFEAARQELEKSLALSPESADARFNLGVLAQRSNRYREARESYLKALSLDPEYLDARYNLVLLTDAHAARAEAEHHYEKLKASAGPDDPRVARLASRFQASARSSGAAPIELRLAKPYQPAE